MPQTLSPEKQAVGAKVLWAHYRAWAKTAGRAKAEQGRLRRVVLWLSLAAVLATPFGESIRQWNSKAAVAFGVVAAVLFFLVGLMSRIEARDYAQQPWVRARSLAEGFKSLAYRFLGGAAPYDTDRAGELAIQHGEAQLQRATGMVPARIDAAESVEKLPAIPLSVESYLKERLVDQIVYYDARATSAHRDEKRIKMTADIIAASVGVLGLVGAYLGRANEVWAPALAAAGTLITGAATRARHRYLAEELCGHRGQAPLHQGALGYVAGMRHTPDPRRWAPSARQVRRGLDVNGAAAPRPAGRSPSCPGRQRLGRMHAQDATPHLRLLPGDEPTEASGRVVETMSGASANGPDSR